MKCHQCGKGLELGPLFRQNEKGRKAVWACMAHNQKAPPDLVTLVEKFSQGKPS